MLFGYDIHGDLTLKKAKSIHLLSLPLKHALNQDHLSDVEIASLLNGQALFYDPASEKWKNKMHRHYTTLTDWYGIGLTEVSTSSTSWTTLIETIFKSYTEAYLLYFLFTHNVKCIGTLATNGADFKITAEDDFGEYDLDGLGFRWIDALSGYKLMHVGYVKYVGALTTMKFRVRWKVDDAEFPCYSKDRFFAVRCWVEGGGIREIY